MVRGILVTRKRRVHPPWRIRTKRIPLKTKTMISMRQANMKKLRRLKVSRFQSKFSQTIRLEVHRILMVSRWKRRWASRPRRSSSNCRVRIRRRCQSLRIVGLLSHKMISHLRNVKVKRVDHQEDLRNRQGRNLKTNLSLKLMEKEILIWRCHQNHLWMVKRSMKTSKRGCSPRLKSDQINLQRLSLQRLTPRKKLKMNQWKSSRFKDLRRFPSSRSKWSEIQPRLTLMKRLYTRWMLKTTINQGRKRRSILTQKDLNPTHIHLRMAPNVENRKLHRWEIPPRIIRIIESKRSMRMISVML